MWNKWRSATSRACASSCLALNTFYWKIASVLVWDAAKRKKKPCHWLKSTKNWKNKMLCYDSSSACHQLKTSRMTTRRASAKTRLIAPTLKPSWSPSLRNLRCCQKNRQSYLNKAIPGRRQWDKMEIFKVLKRNKSLSKWLWIRTSPLRPSHRPFGRFPSLLPWCWKV